jgi:hypothetical protein
MCHILVRKPEKNRPRCRWEDVVDMDLKDIGVRVGNGFFSGQGLVAGPC